jgi:predicted nucleic acid-binding protein
MTPPVFADTAYYLALLSPGDELHARAEAWNRILTAPVVTSAWVIQELADALCAPPTRARFLHVLDTLQSDEDTILIEPDPDLWRRGLALYRARPDKRWSLTDCISFEIMGERSITDALTGDHHFEQAGFRALLREGT